MAQSPPGERSGRRPGRQNTRGVILRAARESFASRGFAGTTLRGIAAAAKVDPALIHHYFDSKRSLFLATIELPVDPPALIADVTAGDPETFGPRLLGAILRIWDSEHRPALEAAVRTAVSDPAMTRTLAEFLSLEMVAQLIGQAADVHPGDPVAAQRRAGLVASTVLGVIVGRYLLELPVLTAQTSTELVASIGPVLQGYLRA